MRVLIVDDNERAAKGLFGLLTYAGHESRIANNGEQALGIAAAFRPEVVLLDIRLPDMDGYDVARCLRKQASPQQMRIVALSAVFAELRGRLFGRHRPTPAQARPRSTTFSSRWVPRSSIDYRIPRKLAEE
jgi:DNA-binding response OmpR family regulator